MGDPSTQKSLEFLKNSFQTYYVSNKIGLPDRFGRREFAFLFFGGKGMVRHLGFEKREMFWNFLAERVPQHTYYSSAYYQHPDAAKMTEKTWMGAELIFDLDSDIPSVSLRKTDSQPKLQLISTADKASLFIFPFPNDFFAAINSAFINEATELPDFEQLFQEFYTIFLQGSTRPFDDSLTENDNEPSDLDSSSSGSLQHNTKHAQLFRNDANYSDAGSGAQVVPRYAKN